MAAAGSGSPRPYFLPALVEELARPAQRIGLRGSISADRLALVDRDGAHARQHQRLFLSSSIVRRTSSTSSAMFANVAPAMPPVDPPAPRISTNTKQKSLRRAREKVRR
jgi:hypothetical protein